MLEFYPEMPFILIGDSGQEDPEIYAAFAQEFPERVLAVYIRNVSQNLARPEAIRKLAEQVIDAGSALVLADDSVAIAKHAIEYKFIAPGALDNVRANKRKDEAPPTPLDKLLGTETKAEPPTVKVEAERPAETKEAVKEGAIEAKVKEKGPGQKPPNVVVESKEAKEKVQKKQQK